jgi:chromosome segregation ATPase
MVTTETPAAETAATEVPAGTEATTTATAETAKTPEQLQAELQSAQNRIHELNKENEKRRKQQEELEKQQKAAEEERLAKQGEFQKLAETRTTELQTAQSELESANAKLTQYETLLGSDIDKRIEKWPEEVKALVPKEGDALQRLQEIKKLEPLANSLMSVPAAGGMRPGPVPSGRPSDVKDLPRPAGYQI